MGMGIATLMVIGLLVGLGLRRRSRQAEWQRRLDSLRDDSDPWPGRRLGDYYLVKLLGVGGMARVYSAVSAERLGQGPSVAVKIITHQDADLIQRFHREVSILLKLRHPNIVSLVTSGQEGEHCYLVMELLRGQTLSQALLGAAWPWPKAVKFMLTVLKAVHFAHQQVVVHRDLKPDNLFLTSDGQLKIMDFGLARAESARFITASGAPTLGTPHYMSPEQINGSAVDGRTDQYALGIELFELLTGRCPFDHEDSMQLIMAHLATPPPCLRQSAPDLPSGLDALVQRMLSKDPAARFPTRQSVAEELEKRGEGPPDAPAAPRTSPPKSQDGTTDLPRRRQG